MARLLLSLLTLYRLCLSPFLGRNCRFFPSCSDYATEALSRYGAVKGAWLSVKRITRCHPWHSGGFDPVP